MADPWLGRTPEPDSPYWPYEKVINAEPFHNADIIPKVLVDYLMDMPDAQHTPEDDNALPRCRLMKLIYYDNSLPLDETLPTVAQKLSIKYDPDNPDKPPDTERGYRIFPQAIHSEAQLNGQTVLKVYLGPIKPISGKTLFVYRQYVYFDMVSNVVNESNMVSTALSRTYSMFTAINEAVAGVNFPIMIGTMTLDSVGLLNDGSTNIGYRAVYYYDIGGTDNAMS